MSKSESESKTTTLSLLENILINLTAFITGAIVMVFELDGSRIIAPYLGASTFTWTALIGIILGSLSLGYSLGGKIADRHATFRGLAIVLLAASFGTLYPAYLKNIIPAITNINEQIWSSALILTVILFAPAAVLLGMVSPYLVRLKMREVGASGQTTGNLYAISTLGSIIGTFLGGFFLISFFGSNKILIGLSLILTTLAICVYCFGRNENNSATGGDKNKKTVISVALILFAIQAVPVALAYSTPGVVADIDTKYNRVWVYDTTDGKTGRPTRLLTNMIYGSQSGIFLDKPDELLFDYTKAFDLAMHFNPNLKQALAVGAGAYTYPRHFIGLNKSYKMDVVEIDPALLHLATKFFSYVDNPRITNYFEDGRVFLNQNGKIYDAIFLDAFGTHLSIPYQLTTLETAEKIYGSLSNRGVILINIISALEGPKSDLLNAEYNTYKKVFPEVLAFQVSKDFPTDRVQNVLLVALKTPAKNSLAETPESDSFLSSVLKRQWLRPIPSNIPVLRDDFAPVEKYELRLLL